MKTEYSTATSAAATSVDETATVTSQRAAADIVTSTAGPVALCTSSSLINEDENEDEDENEGLTTEPSEADACQSSSSSSSSQQEQPNEISSSSTTVVVDEKSTPSPPRTKRINATSIERAKKRRTIDCSDDENNNNSIAENDVQSVTVGQEEDARINLNEQVAHILKTFLDHDDHHVDIGANDNDGRLNSDASFDSSDDEFIIEHMKLITKKNTQMESKQRSVASTAASTAASTTASNDRGVGDESNDNCFDSASTHHNNGAIRMFNANEHDATFWMEMYERLVAYKKEHGDTLVSHHYKKDPELGRWILSQRYFYNNNKITVRHKHLLDSIGFVSDTWTEMYRRLVAFKKKTNHTQVPVKYKEDRRLGVWVGDQRNIYMKNRMLEERERLLKSIGFAWNGRRTPTASISPWDKMYERMVAYKKEHNHVNVPSCDEENPKLGRWLKRQRYAYKKKNMTEERKCRLNSLGVVWNVRKLKGAIDSLSWEGMYERLVAYKVKHRDTRVPQQQQQQQHYKEDPELVKWVSDQRATYWNCNMNDRRTRLLNLIGFVWDSSTTTSSYVQKGTPGY